jgi:hypothetical protein
LDGNILDTDIGIDGFSDKIFRKDRNSSNMQIKFNNIGS